MNRWRTRLAELQGASHEMPCTVQNVQIVQNPTAVPPSEHFEQIEQPEPVPAAQHGTWVDTEAERAAIVEYDGGAPRPWAEALARLDPARVPPNISPGRWEQFIDDCGRFLDNGWAIHAEGLGWRPLDLFGCDRERPPADDDHAGLLWRVEGGKLIVISTFSAIIETATGHQRIFHRRNNRPGELALAWELEPIARRQS
jgi:hypothetical protein